MLNVNKKNKKKVRTGSSWPESHCHTPTYSCWLYVHWTHLNVFVCFHVDCMYTRPTWMYLYVFQHQRPGGLQAPGQAHRFRKHQHHMQAQPRMEEHPGGDSDSDDDTKGGYVHICHSSGHCWDYYPVSLSFLSSHCNSFEDRVPVDFIWSSDELQWRDLKIRH